MPFGAELWYLPISTKDKNRLLPFNTKVQSGIFCWVGREHRRRSVHVKKMFKSKEVGFKEKSGGELHVSLCKMLLFTMDTLFTRHLEAEVMVATSTRRGRPSTSTQAEGGLQAYIEESPDEDDL